MSIKDIKAQFGTRTKGMVIDPLFEGKFLERYADEFILVLKDLDFSISEFRIDDYIRFCALMYDPNSPAVMDYPELKLRKEKVKKLVGEIGYTSREFEMRIMVYIYRNDEHTHFVTIENAFNDYAEKANMILDAKEMDAEEMIKATQLKTKLIKDMGDFREMKRKLMAEMFFGDKDLTDEFKRVRMTAEMAAKI